MIKKKIINILIGASIVLLLSNVLIDVLTGNDKKIKSDEITISQIDSIFFSVIEKFELNDNWIEKKNIKKGNNDSLKYVFYIKIPKDIPVATILKEMNYGFYDKPVKIISEEKINFGKTVIKITSNNNLKLQAFFNVEKDIQREFSKLSFILTNADDLNELEFIRLMRIPFPFALLLIPEEKTYNLLAQTYEFRKEVFLLLNDDVDEKKYSLDPDYEKLRLKNSVLSVISDFPKIINYIVDTESDLYKSTSYNFVKDEFIKRGVKISELAKFVNLDRESNNEIKSLLEFYVSSGKSLDAKTFLISAENFIIMERELSILFNRGTKYLYPSSVN